jgi:hypothetical protein
VSAELPPQKYRVIACSIMKEELLRLSGEGISFVFLEQSLHRTPQKMPPAIQEEINKADHLDLDFLVLGYGLCSNGIVGVKAGRRPLVIPRAHDCISLFLGSCERYREEQEKEPGTYYLTRGWIEEGKSPLGIFDEYCQRYKKETAEWVIREELRNYTRIAMVDSGIGLSEKHREHARENARFFNLKYQEIAGSLDFFARMLRKRWDRDFIIVPPGGEIQQAVFLQLSEKTDEP